MTHDRVVESDPWCAEDRPAFTSDRQRFSHIVELPCTDLRRRHTSGVLQLGESKSEEHPLVQFEEAVSQLGLRELVGRR